MAQAVGKEKWDDLSVADVEMYIADMPDSEFEAMDSVGLWDELELEENPVGK